MKLTHEFFTQKNNSKLFLISIYFLIKFLGTLFALYVFGKYTPLYDSLHFIQNDYAEDQHLRVKIVQVITKFLIMETVALVQFLSTEQLQVQSILFLLS